MDNIMRTLYLHRSNKGFISKFRIGYQDRRALDVSQRADRNEVMIIITKMRTRIRV